MALSIVHLAKEYGLYLIRKWKPNEYLKAEK